MGKQNSKLELPRPPHEDIGFDDFDILRSIGKGSYGKVCLVESKCSKQLFAMKYVNKQTCIKKGALDNICAEVNLLKEVDHVFVVGLWYTFQDAEDLFIILEPLLGGDLRYHMTIGEHVFTEEEIRFISAEISLALDYIRSKNIIHRDVKPDNIILDQQGHARLTDFNVAVKVEPGETIRRLAGTKPYMAPEVFNDKSGYSFAVDWWSLGVTVFELRTKSRPFDIHHKTTMTEAGEIISKRFDKKSGMFRPTKEENRLFTPDFLTFVQALMAFQPDKRVSTLSTLKKVKLMSHMNFNKLSKGSIEPPFVPNGDGLNCDPTFELEEMIIESKPLHKKKKRLQKQQSLLTQKTIHQANKAELTGEKCFLTVVAEPTKDPFESFPAFNRELERFREDLRDREHQWEAELKKFVERRKSSSAVIVRSRRNSILPASGSRSPSANRLSARTRQNSSVGSTYSSKYLADAF